MFCLRNVLKSNRILVFPKQRKQVIKVSSLSTSDSLCKIETSLVNIFDRNTKSLQRQRAAIAEDVNLYDYLKDEIGYRLADRVFDIKRKFQSAADIGTDSILSFFTLLFYKTFTRL